MQNDHIYANIKEDIDYKIKDLGYKTPCWIWQRALTKDGYGRIRIFIGYWSDCTIHRFMYIMKNKLTFNDPRHADHLCRNRSCMNPDHIELKSLVENVMCGNGITAQNSKLKSCRNCGGDLKERTRLRKTSTGAKRTISRYCPKCQYKKS